MCIRNAFPCCTTASSSRRSTTWPHDVGQATQIILLLVSLSSWLQHGRSTETHPLTCMKRKRLLHDIRRIFLVPRSRWHRAQPGGLLDEWLSCHRSEAKCFTLHSRSRSSRGSTSSSPTRHSHRQSSDYDDTNCRGYVGWTTCCSLADPKQQRPLSLLLGVLLEQGGKSKTAQALRAYDLLKCSCTDATVCARPGGVVLLSLRLASCTNIQ